ncbi:MAG: hypothetical protein JW774_10640 [Candidatus Aureabacteria bacterium]|nr:hypothetical protein [Candidatus Auribacterota bacterium]
MNSATVNADVKAILDLQALDAELIQIKTSIEKIPEVIKEIQVTIEKETKDMELFEQGSKKNLLEKKNLEGEIEAKKAQVLKYEIQLNSIKTNTEYSALLKEIETHKQTIFNMEDKLLDMMEQIDKTAMEIGLRKKNLDEKIKSYEKKIDQQNRELTDLKLKQQEKTKLRAEEASHCSGELFNQYERFMRKKKTIALVPLKKNGACGGCRWNLPPNIRNEVMKGKIIQCENCSRLLYWEKEKSAIDPSQLHLKNEEVISHEEHEHTAEEKG